VEPARGPVASPREFLLRVVNDNPHPVSLILGSCPVRYTIDNEFSPTWACDGPSSTHDLAPGGELDFGPEQDARLRFDPGRYPLPPGEHVVRLTLEGVGELKIPFEVEAPGNGAVFVAVRLRRPDGSPLGRPGVAELRTYLPEGGSPESEGGVYRADVGQEGYGLFQGILPGRYLLRARVGNEVRWHPEAGDPTDASPLDVESGFQGPFEVVFPPLPHSASVTHRLRGTVRLRNGEQPPTPLADAIVVAIPAVRSPGRAPKGTSLLFGDPATRGSWSQLAARTGGDGSFSLDVPPGRYRLLAGELAVATYRYWPDTPDAGAATWIAVPEDVPPPAGYRFDLEPLGDLRRVEGRVVRIDALGTAPPAPIGEVEIAAVPLLPSLEGAPTPQRARTDPGGRYALDLPTDTPYLLRARGNGLRIIWYPDTYLAADAVAFDPASETAHHGLDFRLVAAVPPSQGATVEGRVELPGPPPGCPEGADCPHPAAGARLRVFSLGTGAATFSTSARADAEGRFRVEGLPAGPRGTFRYGLLAGALGGPLDTRLSLLPVEAGSRLDVGTIPLAAEPVGARGWLGGLVTDETGAPVEGAVVRAFAWPPSDRDPGTTAVSGTGGRFLFTRLEGGKSVLLSAEAPGFIPTYHPGVSRSSRAEPLAVGDASSPSDPVHIALTAVPTEGGLLAVRVETPPDPGRLAATDTDLAPLEGAFVFVTRAEAAGPEAPVWTGGTTGPAGTVLLTVPEGELVLHVDRPGLEPVTTFPDALMPPGSGETGTAVRTFRLHPPLASGSAPAPGRERVVDLQNLPNPFRAGTSLRYRIEERSLVTVQVFDYRGRLVRTLAEGEEQDPGVRSLPWDGRDEDGRPVSAGVYFFRVQAGPEAASGKMVLLP